MEKIKCITFDKEAQDNLPEHIKAKMKADMEQARQNKCEHYFQPCTHPPLVQYDQCTKCGKIV